VLKVQIAMCIYSKDIIIEAQKKKNDLTHLCTMQTKIHVNKKATLGKIHIN
jgi:hypothetical protein